MAQIERNRFGHYLALAVIAVVVLVYLTPIYWIVATSLKSPSDIIAQVPQFLFRVTFEHYQKLMPDEVPGLAYIFVAEALIGMFACFLPLQDMILARRFALLWNGVLVVTCLYALATTVNYNFLMLAIYTIIVFLLASPQRATNARRIRLSLIGAGVLAIVAICTLFAHGGSKYFHQLLNSIIIGFGSTLLAVGFGTLSAYAFSRFKVAGKEDLLFFILSTRMLPPVVVVIPIYLMYSALGLRDTHFGLILLYTTFNVSFAVWLMKGFIDEIPKEYEDAALVDGYTRFQTFVKVVLPNL